MCIRDSLWSKAEGRTRLEDLGDGRTRIHFSESYLAFNRITRLLLERRVHQFISRDNDKLITKAVNSGLERMRSSGGSGRSGSNRSGTGQ